MKQEILTIINNEFKESERDLVIRELSSIQLEQVMNSEHNLQVVWKAILLLSKGDVKKVLINTRCAREDFWDVVWWADEESKKFNKE